MDQICVKVEEAAQLLRVGRSTVYDLMRTGEIRSVRIGRSRRIPVDALREYVDQLGEAAVVWPASATR
jgi:excisionase family DNA binding protein